MAVLLSISACSSNPPPTEKTVNIEEHQIEKRLDSLLSQMTLKEKIGQMTQLTIDTILKTALGNLVEPSTVDQNKLNKVIIEYGVGSLFNVAGVAYTLDQWHLILNQINATTARTRLKIPVLYGIDAVHGANYTLGATLFPQQIAQAATWNPELVKETARITAYETRASGIPWNFSPVLDLGRNPVWPRFWETFGEDVVLTSSMGKAMVEGFQGDNMGSKHQVAACLKHYLGYSLPLSGKDRTPAWIPERMLREYFLPPFEDAIHAGAMTVMVNSSEINGVPTHVDAFLLKKILRNELKFNGFVVSDWEDIKALHSKHKIAESDKDAVRMAVLAGIDMSMVPMELSFSDYLYELVEEGSVPESRIDEAVRRILRVKFMLGLFDNFKFNKGDYPDFASQKHRDANYTVTAEAMTLLKNNNAILPLAKGTKVLVVGPTANTMRALNGGWTITWQGQRTDEFLGSELTLLEAIQNKNGMDSVTYAQGTGFDTETNIKKAVDLARRADVVIICLGENSYTEKPGDIKDLSLPESQVRLVKQIKRTGKPIIGVLIEGRPRIINQVEPLMDGLVMGYLPGNMGGIVIADILFGDINPSGKLPFTYPGHANDLMTYDHKYSEIASPGGAKKGFDPQFEFGFGLSYTSFSYTNLTLSSDRISMIAPLTVTVDVTNTGKISGKEVVQLYVSDLIASITPSVRRLRDFEKIELLPGETKSVTFKLTPNMLEFVGLDNKWITEPGKFTLHIEKLNKSFFMD